MVIVETYIPPRLTFIGSDPKIPILMKAIQRVARVYDRSPLWVLSSSGRNRFAKLWQARNRRTRVLMERVKRARENA